MPFDRLTSRYPILHECRPALDDAFALLVQTFAGGGKLLLCGNGGSAADCEHIVGELMKGFLLPRPIPARDWERLEQITGTVEGDALAARLQCALPAIALTSHPSLATALANDNGPDLAFAQQVYGLGQAGDALLGISTSGNARNVIAAFQVAQLRGLKTILLTGRGGGKLAALADVSLRVPADNVVEIQELHLPVYHALCIALEAHFFGAEEQL